MPDGHDNPRGNHFFAYALKDRLLELLDPKPLPIRIEARTQSTGVRDIPRHRLPP